MQRTSPDVSETTGNLTRVYVLGLRIASGREIATILEWLRTCIELCGRPLDLMSDNGTEFVHWLPGMLNRFGKTLRELEIGQIKAQVNTPRTNGKIESFWATLKSEVSWLLTSGRHLDSTGGWPHSRSVVGVAASAGCDQSGLRRRCIRCAKGEVCRHLRAAAPPTPLAWLMSKNAIWRTVTTEQRPVSGNSDHRTTSVFGCDRPCSAVFVWAMLDSKLYRALATRTLNHSRLASCRR
jgi:hypothetical protein